MGADAGALRKPGLARRRRVAENKSRRSQDAGKGPDSDENDCLKWLTLGGRGDTVGSLFARQEYEKLVLALLYQP